MFKQATRLGRLQLKGTETVWAPWVIWSDRLKVGTLGFIEEARFNPRRGSEPRKAIKVSMGPRPPQSQPSIGDCCPDYG